MKKHTIYLFLFSFFGSVSCTDEYHLPNYGNQTTFVISGLVTNESGPYYVRVMENISDMTTGRIIQRGINNARVTITDGNGNVDVLQSFFSAEVDSVLIQSGFITGTGIPYEIYKSFIIIPDGNGGIIRFE